jgi:hypothetical protein
MLKAFKAASGEVQLITTSSRTIAAGSNGIDT